MLDEEILILSRVDASQRRFDRRQTTLKDVQVTLLETLRVL